MGYDAINILPVGTRIKDVENFLLLLNYERNSQDKIDRELKAKSYIHFKEEDYSSFSGVKAGVYKRADNNGFNVEYHTKIWASKYDIDYINYTVGQLQKYFGGHFSTDAGKNRYLKFDDHIRIKAEAGCYLAYQNFDLNINKALQLANNIKKNRFEFVKIPRLKMFSFLKELNPNTLALNLIIPFLIAITEEYFRSTYVAMLKYNLNKTKIIKRASFTEDDIERLLKKEISFEEASSRWLNFQELEKINKHFKEQDNRLDLFGKIKKTSKGKESNYDSLKRIINLRHSIIHNSTLDFEYNTAKSINDIELVYESIKIIYHTITTHYKWKYNP